MIARTSRFILVFCAELVHLPHEVAGVREGCLGLVFFCREVLGREPGDLSGFRRSGRKKRLPEVLTVAECRLLFANMHGTATLMAQIQYGAGLRIMELLRLRVQHIDMERLQLAVQFGKGPSLSAAKPRFPARRNQQWGPLLDEDPARRRARVRRTSRYGRCPSI